MLELLFLVDVGRNRNGWFISKCPFSWPSHIVILYLMCCDDDAKFNHEREKKISPSNSPSISIHRLVPGT